jgi:hypothetical protein
MLERAYDMKRTAMLYKQGIYSAVQSFKEGELELNSSSGMMHDGYCALMTCEAVVLQLHS